MSCDITEHIMVQIISFFLCVCVCAYVRTHMHGLE